MIYICSGLPISLFRDPNPQHAMFNVDALIQLKNICTIFFSWLSKSHITIDTPIRRRNQNNLYIYIRNNKFSRLQPLQSAYKGQLRIRQQNCDVLFLLYSVQLGGVPENLSTLLPLIIINSNFLCLYASFCQTRWMIILYVFNDYFCIHKKVVS